MSTKNNPSLRGSTVPQHETDGNTKSLATAGVSFMLSFGNNIRIRATGNLGVFAAVVLSLALVALVAAGVNVVTV